MGPEPVPPLFPDPPAPLPTPVPDPWGDKPDDPWDYDYVPYYGDYPSLEPPPVRGVGGREVCGSGEGEAKEEGGEGEKEEGEEVEAVRILARNCGAAPFPCTRPGTGHNP